MYEEIETKAVVCRKDHCCEWCNEMIYAGEKAESRTYIWEGDFNSTWQHPECFEAMANSNEDIADSGFEQGSLDRGKTFADSACNQ